MSGPRLQHVGGGTHAWVAADGGWGHSNSGVIVGAGESLLVDTLFDLPLTSGLLDDVSEVTAGAPIVRAVNTHGNGDHWFGNAALPADVEIIAAAASLADMEAVGPATVAALRGFPGPVGAFATACFGRFAFDDLPARLPDATFEERTVVEVGGLEVLLLDLGPAHTRGDTVVVCERDGVVFTGDLVFADGTPIMWEGPVANWLRACTRLRELGEELGVHTVVPGHGPVSPLHRVTEMADYLSFVAEEATARHARGMTASEAAADIELGTWAGRPERERLAANVLSLYRELDAAPAPTGPEMFGCMAELLAHWASREATGSTPQED